MRDDHHFKSGPKKQSAEHPEKAADIATAEWGGGGTGSTGQEELARAFSHGLHITGYLVLCICLVLNSLRLFTLSCYILSPACQVGRLAPCSD